MLLTAASQDTLSSILISLCRPLGRSIDPVQSDVST